MLYGATSESFVSSTFGYSYSSSSGFALGGTDATFMLTFQLPAIPPTGSLALLRAFFAPTSNTGGGGMATPQSYSVYIRAMPASTLFMPGVTTGGSSTGGYVYAYVSSYYTDSSGTTTSVNPGQQMMGPPPFMFVPKLFSGSWVTVAVSVSSSNNVTVYARDSVISSSLSFGASEHAASGYAQILTPAHLAGLSQTVRAQNSQGAGNVTSLTGSALASFVSGMLATPMTMMVLGNPGAKHYKFGNCRLA